MFHDATRVLGIVFVFCLFESSCSVRVPTQLNLIQETSISLYFFRFDFDLLLMQGVIKITLGGEQNFTLFLETLFRLYLEVNFRLPGAFNIVFNAVVFTAASN